MKGKCKPLTGLFDINRDFFSIFEDSEPPAIKLPGERPSEKKERVKKEKIINHLVAQKEHIK